MSARAKQENSSCSSNLPTSEGVALDGTPKAHDSSGRRQAEIGMMVNDLSIQNGGFGTTGRGSEKHGFACNVLRGSRERAPRNVLFAQKRGEGKRLWGSLHLGGGRGVKGRVQDVLRAD